MNRIIKISCDGCNTSYDVTRDREAPTTATSMGCNWCPECEGEADDYYDEWYNYNEPGTQHPEAPDNQLMLFSIADDILKPNMAIRRTNYALTSCTT